MRPQSASPHGRPQSAKAARPQSAANQGAGRPEGEYDARVRPRVLDEDEEGLSRHVSLELNLAPHVMLAGSARKVSAVVAELVQADAMHELELASILTKRVQCLQELQKVLKETHGAAVFALLARCMGVLTLLAKQLRETDVSRDRPGAHAARRVALTQQAALLRQLSVRLRPTQQKACPITNQIW